MAKVAPEVGLLDPRAQGMVAAFVAWLRAQGLTVTITSVRRSRAKQAKLYREYLAAKERGEPHLPAAPPGSSLHERGLAWDMVVSPPAYLPVVGRIWEQLGGRWGGRFSDPVHFDFGPNP